MPSLSLKSLVTLNQEPAEDRLYQEWIQQNDVVPFLEEDIGRDDMIVYAGLRHVFLHAILIPRFERSEIAIESLLKWNFGVSSGWCLAGCDESLSIGHPFSFEPDPLVQKGEPIVFLRSLEGVKEKSSYIELNQKITHVLGIHHFEERNAWCNLDNRGDIAEVVKVFSGHTIGAKDGTVVTMRLRELAAFAESGNYAILRMFDFTRFRYPDFSGWPDSNAVASLDTGESIFGTLTICDAQGSYSRGIQIIDPVLKAQKGGYSFLNLNDEFQERYVTFIAYDWRHGRVGEFSCDPRMLANYFTPSPHPFETTPAFFRPEVLSKYKADSDKYRIDGNSITCRGTWVLSNIGFNEAGQVHVYLYRLGRLPLEEQLHWKQFNEVPKALLRESVIKTDFYGDFVEEYNPLSSLKSKLREVAERCTGWWVLRNESLFYRVHYPFTDTRDEWAAELMNLDQLLVEGLDEKWLRRQAEELGRTPDSRLRALKLLEECLCGLGFEESHARQVMSPWHAVHNLRSEVKGHASNSGGRKYEKKARKEHGSLLNHFRSLCEECDDSLKVIISVLHPA